MEDDKDLEPLFESYRACLSDKSELIECHQFRMGFSAAVKLMADGLDYRK